MAQGTLRPKFFHELFEGQVLMSISAIGYLANAGETDLRRAEEKNLLELYRQTLAQAGIAPPDSDPLWRRYRLHCPYSWVSATVTAAMGDKWQPQQVGMDSMRRTTQAVQDLGSVELFREELGL